MDNYITRKISRKVGDTIYHLYYDKSGDKIDDKEYIKKITAGIYIPPRYRDVKINIDVNKKIRAIGYDDKNRPQYIYHKQHIERQKNKKFNQMIPFGKKFSRINKVIQKDIQLSDNSKNNQIAIILKLIMDCHFRVGSEKYLKDNQSYGTTTLEKKHITETKDGITINFIGKKKVHNFCNVKDKLLIKTLKRKKRNNRSPKLFTYQYKEKDVTIKPSDVNKYLKQFGDISTKNFRTWGANIEYIRQLLHNHSTEKHPKYAIKESINKVAFKLHNTVGVCKSNYIDPEITNFYSIDPHKFVSYFKGDKNSVSKHVIQSKYIHFLESIA